MQQTKNFFQSKTIIAILTAILVLIAQKMGYHLDYSTLDADTQNTIGEVLKYSSLGIAIIARAYATHQLSIRQKP